MPFFFTAPRGTGEDGSKEYEQVVVQVSGGTTTSVRTLWYDSMRQEDCVFMLAADGVQRCLPLGYPSTVQYSDAQCTQPAALVPASLPGCPDDIPKYVISIDPATVCPKPLLALTNHIYTVGDFLGNVLLYDKTQNGCVANNGNFPAFLKYSLIDEVPAGSFVQASLGVDP